MQRLRFVDNWRRQCPLYAAHPARPPLERVIIRIHAGIHAVGARIHRAASAGRDRRHRRTRAVAVGAGRRAGQSHSAHAGRAVAAQPVAGTNWTQLPAAAAARNEIALTIDDGPDPSSLHGYWLCWSVTLSRHLFCVGDKAACYPDLCRKSCAVAMPWRTTAQHHRVILR